MADQMYDWVSSKTLPNRTPPEGYSTIYRRGSSDYSVGYSYVVEDGSYKGRPLRSEKWPPSHEHKGLGIVHIASQTAARVGCLSIFEGRFHIADAWLKRVFEEEDARFAVVAQTLTALGYNRETEVRCVFRTTLIRSKNFSAEPVSADSFSDGHAGTLGRDEIVEISYLGDGTIVGWWRDYGKRPVILLPRE